MARPRRSTGEAFYDVFADFTVEDQAAALRILEQIHRLAVREAAKRKSPAPAILAGRTEIFAGDSRIDSLSELAADPGNNAALLLDDNDDKGPKQ
jgi:hypothetical protein